MGSIVEIVARDLSMGFAGLSGSVLPFSSSTRGSTPRTLDHVGVIVYAILFEYGPGGVSMSDTLTMAEKFRYFPMGETNKAKDEIINWAKNKNTTLYKGCNYNISDHNCICFAEELCALLGLKELPEEIVELKEWVKKNNHVCKFGQMLAP